MVTIVQPQISGFQPRSEGNDLYYGTELGILDAFIDGGLGNDAFIGNSSGTDSNGIADSFLSGSEGADLIIGNAVGVGSVGIFDSIIDLGADDDRLLARGDQLGIFDLNLDAGPGNDYIDIRSGDGNLSGNTGMRNIQ